MVRQALSCKKADTVASTMAWSENQDDLWIECVCAGLYAVGLTPAAVAESFGEAERWRPHGTASRKRANQRSKNWTEFQLPSPDAIYSRDEEKKRRVGGHPAFVWVGARPTCCCGKSDRGKEATRPAA
ncbi:hypothetical protein EJ07DRAFT_160200 [Lizonia empirigonia]|nr:hypothetical protein EJ07DRAFT_160200 [Lizonia empirigonia]